MCDHKLQKSRNSQKRLGKCLITGHLKKVFEIDIVFSQTVVSGYDRVIHQEKIKVAATYKAQCYFFLTKKSNKKEKCFFFG